VDSADSFNEIWLITLCNPLTEVAADKMDMALNWLLIPVTDADNPDKRASNEVALESTLVAAALAVLAWASALVAAAEAMLILSLRVFTTL
jgi:hypothetical protein